MERKAIRVKGRHLNKIKKRPISSVRFGYFCNKSNLSRLNHFILNTEGSIFSRLPKFTYAALSTLYCVLQLLVPLRIVIYFFLLVNKFK